MPHQHVIIATRCPCLRPDTHETGTSGETDHATQWSTREVEEARVLLSRLVGGVEEAHLCLSLHT